MIAPALGQAWPTKPMTMVVPFAAGSSSDIVGRIIAPRLSELLGQPVIVENVGGAGGMTGANRVAKAAPDGYQFVLGTGGTHGTNQTLYRNPQYNAATDFAPVALIVEQTIVLVARKDLPANDLQEFRAYASANQAKMQYGSPGAGSAPHLSCALLNSALGINVIHVPYRGAASGHPGSHRRPDRLRVLHRHGRDSADREPDIEGARNPDQGPFAKPADTGHRPMNRAWPTSTLRPGMEFSCPSTRPTPIIQKLHRAVVAAMNTPAVRERLKETGTDLVAEDRRSPDYLGRFVVAEIERWAAVIKSVGLSVD